MPARSILQCWRRPIFINSLRVIRQGHTSVQTRHSISNVPQCPTTDQLRPPPKELESKRGIAEVSVGCPHIETRSLVTEAAQMRRVGQSIRRCSAPVLHEPLR